MMPHSPVRFFLFVSKPYWYYVLPAVFFVFTAAVIGQSLPLFYKWIIEAVEARAVEQALLLGLLYPAVVFLESNLWRLSGVFGMYWSIHIRQYANDILVEYTLKHGQEYFSNRFAGSLLNKISNVVAGVETYVHDFLWTILGMTVSVGATLYYLFSVNTLVAWLFVCLLVFLLIINSLMMGKKKVLSREQALIGSQVRGRTADMFGNASVIRQFTGVPAETSAMRSLSVSWRDAQRQSWLYSELTQWINSFILFIFFALMMYVLISGWGGEAASIAELVFVIALITSLTGRLVFVGRVMNGLAKTHGEVEEGLAEILVPHEIINQTDRELVVKTGTVALSNISFTYGQNSIFDNLSLMVRSGERVGLVGSSGAGKSTLVSLLLRQYELNSGVITIDGQDITAVTQESLRSAIAVVPQEPALFHRSIEENIAYGRPSASIEDIEQVATQAYAHDFIMSLPHGYDTLVGERGVKLSGGQKQRIAIARAMLKQAPILVLDEATSALDSESEVEIQKALHQLMIGKTVIAIAHRLSTLREMDRIIVLHDGVIVEDGTHEALLNYGGRYARLWHHQAGGFVLE